MYVQLRGCLLKTQKTLFLLLYHWKKSLKCTLKEPMQNIFLLNVTFTGQMQKVSDIVSCNC